jgi:hypothetical protein
MYAYTCAHTKKSYCNKIFASNPKTCSGISDAAKRKKSEKEQKLDSYFSN